MWMGVLKEKISHGRNIARFRARKMEIGTSDAWGNFQTLWKFGSLKHNQSKLNTYIPNSQARRIGISIKKIFPHLLDIVLIWGNSKLVYFQSFFTNLGFCCKFLGLYLKLYFFSFYVGCCQMTTSQPLWPWPSPPNSTTRGRKKTNLHPTHLHSLDFLTNHEITNNFYFI